MFQYETSAFFCTTGLACYLTISAGSKPHNQGRNTSMYSPSLCFHMLSLILMLLFTTPLTAQNSDQARWIEAKDQWGQVLFCQTIYKMPEVQTRLYDFDVKRCDEASQLMTNAISVFSKQDQVQLKALAEQHAYRLSRFTSEPYQSVPACREFCQEVIDTGGQRND